MANRLKKGVTSEDKGVYIPIDKRAPYNPNNIRLSKAQFIEQEQKRKAKELKLKEIAAAMDRDSAAATPVIKPPTEPQVEVAKPKPRGRPKKIE